MHHVDISILRRNKFDCSSVLDEGDTFTRFSTDAFFDRLRRSFIHDPPERIAIDFVFLALLTGNDYLPHLHKYYRSLLTLATISPTQQLFFATLEHTWITSGVPTER